MPTHAELAAQLLNDAASFFKNVAEENTDVADDMRTNAGVFENLAHLMENDPMGATGGEKHAVMASRLLHDSAQFFKSLASDNEPIRDQMNENARVFEEISVVVKDDPFGVIE